jgi:hypothetical protein
MIISLHNPYEDLPLFMEPLIKRPNKGMQKYGKYKLMIDLECAKLIARSQYRARVKNQK